MHTWDYSPINCFVKPTNVCVCCAVWRSKVLKNDVICFMAFYLWNRAELNNYQVDIYCNIGTCGVSSSIFSQVPIQLESCSMFLITTSACSQVILQEVLPFLHKNVEWVGKPHFSTSVSHISEGWILSLKIKKTNHLSFKCFMSYFCHELFLISHVPKQKNPDFDLTITVVKGTLELP